MRLRWTVAFLTVTAAAIGMELWAAGDGNPQTDPWTTLVARYVPAPITFTLIGLLIALLPLHFWRAYRRRAVTTNRARKGNTMSHRSNIDRSTDQAGFHKWLQSLLPSVIRTVVPLIVGYLLASPVVAGLFNADQVTTGVTLAVTAGYYLAVRLLEQYVWPPLGLLLGWISVPVYVPAEQVTTPAVGPS